MSEIRQKSGGSAHLPAGDRDLVSQCLDQSHHLHPCPLYYIFPGRSCCSQPQPSLFRHSSIIARFRKCGYAFLETLLRQNSKNIQ